MQTKQDVANRKKTQEDDTSLYELEDFFFKAADVKRDSWVTRVQTCALASCRKSQEVAGSRRRSEEGPGG